MLIVIQQYPFVVQCLMFHIAYFWFGAESKMEKEIRLNFDFSANWTGKIIQSMWDVKWIFLLSKLRNFRFFFPIWTGYFIVCRKEIKFGSLSKEIKDKFDFLSFHKTISNQRNFHTHPFALKTLKPSNLIFNLPYNCTFASSSSSFVIESFIQFNNRSYIHLVFTSFNTPPTQQQQCQNTQKAYTANIILIT